MKRPLVLQQEYSQVGTIQSLTSVFEAIASIHIAQLKDKVAASNAFFGELWEIYSDLYTGKAAASGRATVAIIKKPAIVIITSEGGLIGDIDDRIVTAMQQHEQLGGTDLYVVGAHGAALLSQRGIKPKATIQLPNIEKGDNVRALTKTISQYEQAVVYYQAYTSLARQDVARMELFSALTTGEAKTVTQDTISQQNYIFEPSLQDIIRYMESVMIEIALGQVILESELAQYASRFNAMYAAKTKAQEMHDTIGMSLHRAKRMASDERTKEIVSAQKVLGRT